MYPVRRQQHRRRVASWPLMFVWVCATSVHADGPVPLFAASELRTVDRPAHSAAVPARLGRIDGNLLLASSLQIELPDGRRVLAVRESIESPDGVHPVWSGRTIGVGDSAVSVTRHRDVFSGQIQLAGETFELAPLWTGEYMLYAVDVSCRPPFESDAPALQARRSGRSTRSMTMSQDEVASDREHMTVLYTSAARDRWSEHGGIEARILASIASINRRAVGRRLLRIETMQEVAYTETGNLRSALQWLQRGTAAGAEAVPAADIPAARQVVIVTEDNNLCGVSAATAEGDVGRMLHAVYSSCLSATDLAAQFEAPPKWGAGRLHTARAKPGRR